MAEKITIKLEADAADFKREVRSAMDAGSQNVRQFNSAIHASRSAVAGLTSAFTALAALNAFKAIAGQAIEAALAIDRQVNSLKALTGSAEAATRRFQELFRIAQATPGLTTSLAATLDAQLRIFSVAEGTINKLLPVIGRLNAISSLDDPRQFVNNLTQLITQNFERQDLKELVGQSPIAGQLIKQIFNVDNPTNAEAIRAAAKRLSITSVERLADEFIKAGESNPAIKNAVEALGGQFDKLRGRLEVALAPVGEQIARTLLPVFDDLVKAVERYGANAAQTFRDNKNDIIAAAKAIAGMTVEVGKLIAKLGELAVKSRIPEFLGRAAAESRDIIESKGANLFTFAKGPRLLEFERQLGVIEAERKLPRLSTDPSVLSGVVDTINAVGDFTRRNREKLAGAGGLAGAGVTGVRGLATSRDATKRAHDVADLIRKIADARAESDKVLIQSLEEVERTITGGVIETGRQAAAAEALRSGRPAQLAAFGVAQTERIRQIDLETLRLEENTAKKAFEELKKIEPILSNSERFMRGFAAATDSVGDAFERFGANVSSAFSNVRDLFNGLKQAVLGFFNDLLGSALQNLVRSTLGPIFGGAGGLFGGGISAPASISGGAGIIGQIFGRSGGGSAGSAASSAASAVSGGFSLPSGQQAATALSLGGLQLGVSLGGQSTAGKILGGFGGSLGIFSVLGAPLFIAGALLGRGKQRRQDEEAAGQFQRQAYQSIGQLKSGIDADQIDGSQARAIFENQILAQFIQQISGLRTESVRRSRLTNQVADLRRDFENLIGQSIAAQEARKAADLAKQAELQARQAQLRQNALIHSKLIPEFATGGIVSGRDRGFDSVWAMLRPGEMVLNQQQQAAVRAQAGPGVFDRAGVPGVNLSGRFAQGGIAPSADLSQPIEINLEAQVVIGKGDATKIVITGGSTNQGRAVTVNNIKVARTNREL